MNMKPYHGQPASDDVIDYDAAQGVSNDGDFDVTRGVALHEHRVQPVQLRDQTALYLCAVDGACVVHDVHGRGVEDVPQLRQVKWSYRFY